MVLQVYYWDLRALGEPIRLMLEHMGVEYENLHPASADDWFAKKYNSGLEYPNIPYLIDGDVKVTQSFAVMRYISRKFNTLGGDTELEKQKIDTAEGFCGDLRMNLIKSVWFAPNYNVARQQYFSDMPAKLLSLESVLVKQKWAAGDKLSYVDFAMCEALDWHVMMEPSCLDATPYTKKYYEAFFALPRIAAYRTSGRFKNWPVSGGAAHWGNDNNKAKI